jgi:sigma-B regulation protein RsbU (phosphoserine phosphatase)
VIADVSDKGIPAALYMMFARTLLRAAAFSGREPAAALARANELILADSTSDMFVTAYYSVLEVAEGTLTYASGGHNLALYAPAGGDHAAAMITGGIALGIILDAEFEQKTLALSPGDVVLFYTDGALDTRNAAGEEFGEERLAGVLLAALGEPAEAIADAIDTAVRVFAGEAAQYDDLTLIVVKRV